MQYSNIKLVHIVDGVNVRYDNISQNPEVLFAYDENDNIIQKFTYPCEIHPDKKNIINDTTGEIIIEEKCFLFYSYYFQISFAHYISQCLPKLKYVIDDDSYKIVIPISTFTYTCKEFLSIIGIDEKRIIFLEDNILYTFKNLHTVENFYHAPGGFVHSDVVYVCSILRSKLKIENSNPHRKVYLKKDGLPNTKFNNTETGISRKIVNESEIIKFLELNGFEIIKLGDKTILEKVELMKDIKILITQLGANCMNLIFSNVVEKCLILSNDRPIGPDYYLNLVQTLTGRNIDYTLLQYPSLDLNADPKNSTNSPFLVNIDDIVKHINS